MDGLFMKMLYTYGSSSSELDDDGCSSDEDDGEDDDEGGGEEDAMLPRYQPFPSTNARLLHSEAGISPQSIFGAHEKWRGTRTVPRDVSATSVSSIRSISTSASEDDDDGGYLPDARSRNAA